MSKELHSIDEVEAAKVAVLEAKAGVSPPDEPVADSAASDEE